MRHICDSGTKSENWFLKRREEGPLMAAYRRRRGFRQAVVLAFTSRVVWWDKIDFWPHNKMSAQENQKDTVEGTRL